MEISPGVGTTLAKIGEPRASDVDPALSRDDDREVVEGASVAPYEYFVGDSPRTWVPLSGAARRRTAIGLLSASLQECGLVHVVESPHRVDPLAVTSMGAVMDSRCRNDEHEVEQRDDDTRRE
jgi:hypothetical protein